MTTPDFTVSLMRGFCQDWLNRADPAACKAITTDEYEVNIGGNQTAWRGIALFWTDSRRLIRNVTEEDYTSRRRQLSAAAPDEIESPAVAPWSTMPVSASAAAEQQVRDWLAGGGIADSPAGNLIFDEGTETESILDVDSVEILDLFSAGRPDHGAPDSRPGRPSPNVDPDSRLSIVNTNVDSARQAM
jgi:hypothetical protein